jgi:subtilisin family serine protease
VKGAKFFYIVVLFIVASSIPIMAFEYRSDEVIVKFKTKLPQGASAMALADERPMTIAVDDAEKAIAELKASEDIEYVEPNYVIEAEIIPNDWPYPGQWSYMALESAWNFIDERGPGEKVVVALIDSGVDITHPEFQGMLIPGYDFANNDDTPEDDSGHGTKVCGILGALGNNNEGIAGVAWDINMTIMPLKFMKNNEGKTTGNLSDAVDAIYYAVDNGAKIINASWGFYSYSHALEDVIKYAENHDVLFVASAGNKGQNNDASDHFPSNYSFDNIIAVAALDTDGSLASFSNYGSKNVDIVAPGVGITTTTINSGYVSWVSGTSFSTPVVTAVAAMVISQSPSLDYSSVRSIILETATKTPIAGSNMVVASGGCVNAYEALLAEESYDPSSKAAPSLTDTQAVDNGSALDSGVGGGGCLIDVTQTAGNYTSFIILMIMIVLFQIPRNKDLE